MIRRFARLTAGVNRVMMAFGGAALLALMALAVVNIAARLLKLQFPGAYELVGFLGAVAVSFALGHTQETKSHVAVDLVTRRYPRRIMLAIDRLRYLAKIALSGMLCVEVARWGVSIRQSGEVSETLKMPYHPFVFCVAAGFAVLTLTVTVDLLRTFERGRPGVPGETAS